MACNLKKIHHAIGFMQSPWLKLYIDFNTEKRKSAQNSFEKDDGKYEKEYARGTCEHCQTIEKTMC